MRHFPYIKQNSIAEIVSTMESFLCKDYKKDIFGGVLAGFEPPGLAKFSAGNLNLITTSGLSLRAAAGA